MKILLLLTLLNVPVVSKYLSFFEATKSAHAVRTTGASAGLRNIPSQRQLILIQSFGRYYFDSLRIRAGSPLYVSSLYRSVEINKIVGGAKSSEHMILGDVVAVDIDQDAKGKIGNTPLFFIIMKEFPYRKLIWEFGDTKKPDWVHWSVSADPSKNIGKVYRATKVGNRTVYTIFNNL